MGITVGWLLDQPAVALRCHGGVGGLEREIDCVVTSELVDAADWLSGGELMLTTGMRLPPDAAGRVAYLRSLAEVGIAGLGFGTGLGHDTVPADLVAVADALDLPLLEVPLPVPFSAITRMLLERLAEERHAQFTRAYRSQPAMTRAVMAGGVASLVAELAAALDRSVAFIDSDGRVVSSSSRGSSSGAAGTGATDQAALTHVRALIARGPMSTTGVTITAEHTITVQRITGGVGVAGYLAVIGTDPLGDVDRVLVGHAASLVTLQHAEAGNVAADRAALNSEIFDLALQGSSLPTATARTLLGRAADATGAVRVAVYEFRSAATAATAVQTIGAELSARWRPVFTLQRDCEVVVLVRGDDDVTVVRALAGSTRMRAGLGPATDLTGVTSSAGHARQAVRSALDGEVVDLATTRSVLALHAVQDGLRSLHDVRLRPLVEARQAGSADLVATLRGYLESNGHWESAASVVGVHRHTLRARVSRIESLLGVDLADARTRAELLLILLSGDRPAS